MKRSSSIGSYGAAVLLVAASSFVCEALRPHLNPVNMVMVYLLAVVLAAATLGLKPAILTSLTAVLAFDFLFVPPRFSFRVSDTEYLLTFFGLFVVGVVISSLVARLKESGDHSRRQEERTSSLYRLTRELAVAGDIAAVIAALQRAVKPGEGESLLVMLPRGGGLAVVAGDGSLLAAADRDVARWVMSSGRSAGRGTAVFAENGFRYVPLSASGRVLGIMALASESPLEREHSRMIGAFADQAAMALERIELGRQAEEIRVERQKELLERSLLNSISHDLRTPLVTITGALGSMLEEKPFCDTAKNRQLLATALEEAERLNRFVGTLLDMTRLESGVLSPVLLPCDPEEIIGCGIGAMEQRLGEHLLSTRIEVGLPPVAADMALMTQVLVNLLDNAVKYAPADGGIEVSAARDGDRVVIAVSDRGPGVPPGEEEKIFDKFYRLQPPEQRGGTGLGLSIVRGIVEAHHGSVAAANRQGGGLEVAVSLPVAAEPEGGGEES